MPIGAARLGFWSSGVSISPNVLTVNEGETVNFLIKSSIGNVYWSVETVTGSVNASDFVDGAINGEIVISNGVGSLSLPISVDETTEGNESFLVNIRVGSVSGPIIAKSKVISINDTSLTPTYSITPAASSVNEGSSLIINVSTTNVVDGRVLYWTVNNTTTTNADFLTTSGSFTINSNSASFSISTTADSTTEGAETFTVSIRTSSTSGTVVATSNAITINDTSLTPYSITASDLSVSEGQMVTFNITTPAATGTFYWNIEQVSGTIDANDFAALSGSVSVTNSAGSFNLTPIPDGLVEGEESFRIILRTGSNSGPIVATSDTVIIKDTFDFDADYIIAQYTFTDGTDLDSRSRIVVPFEGPYHGFGQTNPGGPILTFGGDNTGTGVESVLLDVLALKASYPAATSVSIECRAQWYGTVGIQPVSMTLIMYKGGTMVKSGFTWTNSTATDSRTVSSAGKVVTLASTSGASIGQQIGFINYNFISGVGSIVITV
jgi:hypothetical protein